MKHTEAILVIAFVAAVFAFCLVVNDSLGPDQEVLVEVGSP